MAIERSRRRIAAARLAAVARELLDASTLCAIATVGPGRSAHVNTAYFAWSPEFDIIWLSEPGAKHSQNVRANESVAIAVYDSTQMWGKPDRGIQLFGTAQELDGRDAARAGDLYAARFSHFAAAPLSGYHFYSSTPHGLKLLDEEVFGAGTFVTARVGQGGKLAWERTELYRSQA